MKKTTNPVSKFDQVVVLMLENRWFDKLFGFLMKMGVPDSKTFECFTMIQDNRCWFCAKHHLQYPSESKNMMRVKQINTVGEAVHYLKSKHQFYNKIE